MYFCVTACRYRATHSTCHPPDFQVDFDVYHERVCLKMKIMSTMPNVHIQNIIA